MTAFPHIITGVGAVEPFSETLEFKTLITQNDFGEEKRKQKWLYPRRSFPIKYKSISIANAKTLYSFFIARAGAKGEFSFFCPFSDTYTGEYVGSGNGSQVIWALPASGASSRYLYVDGVLQAESTDYTYSATGGPDGEGKVTFAVAPADATRITFTFAGYLKVRCRFKDDVMSFENFYNRLVSSGIILQGLLNTSYTEA